MDGAAPLAVFLCRADSKNSCTYPLFSLGGFIKDFTSNKYRKKAHKYTGQAVVVVVGVNFARDLFYLSTCESRLIYYTLPVFPVSFQNQDTNQWKT